MTDVQDIQEVQRILTVDVGSEPDWQLLKRLQNATAILAKYDIVSEIPLANDTYKDLIPYLKSGPPARGMTPKLVNTLISSLLTLTKNLTPPLLLKGKPPSPTIQLRQLLLRNDLDRDTFVSKLKELIAAGADVKVVGGLLLRVIELNDLALVQAVLDAGGNVNDTRIWSILFPPVFDNEDPKFVSDDIVLLLIARGLNVKNKVYIKEGGREVDTDPVYLALDYERSFAVVKAMVEAGANVESTPESSDHILNQALGLGAPAKETQLYLISKTTNVNIPDENELTPLHEAVTSPVDLEVITALLDKGANVNAVSDLGGTPLLDVARWAATYAEEETNPDPMYAPIAKLLLSRGGQIDDQG